MKRFLSSVTGDSNLEKHQPIGIDSRDPESLKASTHPPETFSLSTMSHLAFSPMPTCFTMVASLSRSNCLLPAFRRMARYRSDFASRWIIPNSSLLHRQRQPSQQVHLMNGSA
ncbi:hypothetical protein TNCV_96001 [Trichonephila clavipes]|nr:hypothetical protein TNCV_96001 [Trichonephila clavipes]